MPSRDVLWQEKSQKIVLPEGLRIEKIPSHGRAMVASRKFEAGEVVLTETPLLVWPHGEDELRSCVAFLAAFQRASPTTRATVLYDFYHPKLDDESSLAVPKYGLLAAAILRTGSAVGLTEVQVHRLLLIKATNAHAYYGKEMHFDEILETTANTADKEALFVAAAKVSHACVPNTSYSSKRRDGKLEYRAIRAIAAGDLVTFSYIENVWTTPTADRRAELRANYGFHCRCAHCEASDDTGEQCRQLRCPTCSGLARYLVHPPEVEEPSRSVPPERTLPRWVCTVDCGPLPTATMAPGLAAEEAIADEFARLTSMLHRDCMSIKPSSLKRLAVRAARDLAPTHRLVILIQQDLATQFASLAKIVTDQPFASRVLGDAQSLRADAALEGLRGVAICECLAHGCHGGAQCTIPHKPINECAKAAFHACQDLLAMLPTTTRRMGRQQQGTIPRSALPLVAFAKKYLRDFAITYGDNDTDVCELRTRLFAGDLPTAPPATALGTDAAIRTPSGPLRALPPTAPNHTDDDDDWTAHITAKVQATHLPSATKKKKRTTKKDKKRH